MNQIRVLHIVFSLAGGAGSVVKSIQEYQKGYLKKVDIESISEKNSYFEKLKHPVIYIFSMIDNYIIRKSKTKIFFSIFRSKLNPSNLYNFLDYENLHLHWTPGILNLVRNKYIHEKKIVLHLHDMWFLTGGCHFSGNCKQYITGCKDCPFVKKSFKKIIRNEAKIKKDFVEKNNVELIAPSTRLYNIAKTSYIAKNANIIYLPNPSSKIKYRDITKNRARKKIKVTEKSFLIGFIAMNLNEERKNIGEFYKLLHILNKKYQFFDIKGVTCGKGKILDSNLDITNLGFVTDELSKFYFYKAIDVLFMPSIDENLPVVIQDSIKYGVPTVINILSSENRREFAGDNVYYYKNFEDLNRIFSYEVIHKIKLKKINKSLPINQNNLQIVKKINDLYVKK